MLAAFASGSERLQMLSFLLLWSSVFLTMVVDGFRRGEIVGPHYKSVRRDEHPAAFKAIAVVYTALAVGFPTFLLLSPAR